ncbi:MAG: tripartite tricarboxylate transporter TctB family protein [Candidatus Nitrohelix vancouverensis]|uniref:Tripartite tricarboxylate transporter TctB family protein n=1 Tax=Candidatus Nitrohelix vancouverensis TaxID=2705534 RepID=A0A7T0G2J9_9BACT|nr:MAG: tripartite tricarboxylate transporter TctB family protein [Candidatus Nitrohelix vancouverensis]
MESYRSLKQDIIASLAILLLSIFTIGYLIPNHVAEASVTALSPRFFPLVGAVSIGLFALCLCLTSTFSLKRLTNENQIEATTRQNAKLSAFAEFKRPLIVFAILCAFVFAFESFGYLVGAPVALSTLMFAFGQRRPLVLFVHSPLIAGLLFLAFEYGLGLPLS